MYKLEVKKNEESDVSDEEYDFVVNDLASSILDKIEDISEEEIKREGNILYFNTKLTVKEIKIALKDVFLHHINEILYVDLIYC